MDVVRAWKDPEYRETLAVPPDHPSGGYGLAQLDMSELAIAAGAGSQSVLTIGCCGTPATFTLTIPVLCSITLSVCPRR
ncbi:mersacidin/lichenicidin family type 2 lantibiotic [Streptomyces sp. NPDC005209]|uniref:mersacidin/lichenicidin family type 2 lantibiotic n=1 Tax=Streptomyces sp. NPDC005209 TaxID=3156715 RepID=UPI0033A2361A